MGLQRVGHNWVTELNWTELDISNRNWFCFSSVQSLSRVQLFVTPQIAARQASLSITNPQSPPKPMSTESVMPSNHLILCHPLLFLPSIFPSIRVFSNEPALAPGGQSIGVSASASVLPMNIQDWSPLGLTGWISLQSKGLSRVFSNTTVQKHQFFSAQLSLWSSYHIRTWLLDRNLKYTKSALKISSKTINYWKFPGGLVIKILCVHCQGSRFKPWSEN